MTAKKQSFADVMAKMMAEKGTTCALCELDDASEIDEARTAGVPFMDIAKACQVVGIIDPNVTSATARTRVSKHYQVHVTDPARSA